MLLSFEQAILAFADATVRRKQSILSESTGDFEAVSEFLLAVHSRMPDYLRLPFRFLVLLFDAWPYPATGKPFHRLSLPHRTAQIESWERSRLEFRRRLIEFYGTLATFGLYSELYGHDYQYSVPAERT